MALKLVVVGALCQLVAYVAMISSPPFAVMVCSYVLIGFGISIQVSDTYASHSVYYIKMCRAPKRTGLLGAFVNTCR